MPYMETNDHTRLFYRDWGAGPAVLFVHGWAVGADIWEYQMTPLSCQGLRCIAYDQRGCGRSDDPGRGFDYNTLADDLAAVINQLDLHDITLVSHSMGGGVVARYLTRYGAGRIARTVLVATTTPFLLKTEDNPEGIEQSVFDTIAARLLEDRPGYYAEIAPGFFGVGQPECSVSPEKVQWGVNLAMQASPKATVELVHTNSQSDQRAEMQAFTMPTLIIHGDSDQGNPVELTGQKTAQLIPGSRLMVYEGGPHGLFITHKDRFNADLRAFMNE
jgi:non-heme chloroperoxidase